MVITVNLFIEWKSGYIAHVGLTNIGYNTTPKQVVFVSTAFRIGDSSVHHFCIKINLVDKGVVA